MVTLLTIAAGLLLVLVLPLLLMRVTGGTALKTGTFTNPKED